MLAPTGMQPIGMMPPSGLLSPVGQQLPPGLLPSPGAPVMTDAASESSTAESGAEAAAAAAVEAAAAATEADNWTEHVDKASGRPYWHNKLTKKSVWSRPPGWLSAKEKAQPVSSERIEGTDWLVVFTRGGSTYYHNAVTKETTWTLPDSLNTPAPAPEEALALKSQVEDAVKARLDEEQGEEMEAGEQMTVAGGDEDEDEQTTHGVKRPLEEAEEEQDEADDEPCVSLLSLCHCALFIALTLRV